MMDEILPLKKVGATDTPTGSCLRLPFVDPFKSLFGTDATTNLNLAENRSTESSKDKVLFVKTDATTNLNVAEDSSCLI